MMKFAACSNSEENMNMLLAGDIGGTKTHLAVFSSRSALRTPLAEATLPSARYPSLEALVHEFLAGTNFSVERASFGVAGPVIEGQAKTTNLPWIIDEKQLQESLHIPTVDLVNDLVAMAHFVPFLEAADLRTLNVGQPESNGTLALIAPGTGLGEAFLTWDGTRYQPHASEGGHTEFGPTNAFELDLLRFLLTRIEHVSYEHVCSGIGLPNIYAYLKERNPGKEPQWLAEQLAAASDPTPVIVNAALVQGEAYPLCVATLKTFVSILGAEAGNLALKVLATGGVYIGGGIPPRILSFLEDGTCMQVFRSKGRLAEVLVKMPVHVITNTKLALLGAAYHGFGRGGSPLA
jgi:glucokinase